MEQSTENKEIAPCFDIDKFTEDTREALLVLNLHYFSKLLEENEKLKQISYSFIWNDGQFIQQKIVRADSKEEAIKKFLFSCDESLQIIINEYMLNYMLGHKTENFFKGLIELGFLPKSSNEYSQFFYDYVKSINGFKKQYHEFLEKNLDDAIYLFRYAEKENLTIIEIDENLIIE